MNLGLRFLSTRASITRLGIPMDTTSTSDLSPGPYAGWTRERLVERLMQLEGTTSEVTVGPSVTLPPTPPIPTTSNNQQEKFGKPFRFSRYPRRKIALKFCYSGWEYSGLAFQMLPTPLPTVENVLFDVMAKAHLVDPDGGFDACGWERCGRTDRGVSAAGQVVSLWIRSQLEDERDERKQDYKPKEHASEDVATEGVEHLEDQFGGLTLEAESSNGSVPTQKRNSKPKHELDYLAMLNRLLPDTIRIIAWSPVLPTFSARFSCKYRHYKYFLSSLHLDIPRMEAAASRLLGEHDFRNLCKLDVQKQITSFRRKILRSDITSLDQDDGHGRMYVFDLVGTAFLYHQVRHIVAALFLVGSGLEPPERITELMNVEEGTEPLRDEDAGKTYAVVGSKPDYQMADGLPLMLWKCGYDDWELDWRTSRIEAKGEADLFRGALYHQMQGIYTRSRVYAALDRHFVRAMENHHPPPPLLFPLQNGVRELDSFKDKPANERAINVPLGGGTFKRLQKYKPLLERSRLDTVEVMNERWRLGKGMRRDEKRRAEAQAAADDYGDE